MNLKVCFALVMNIRVSDRNYQEEDGILVLNRIFPNVGLGLNVENVLGFEKDYILHTAAYGKQR